MYEQLRLKNQLCFPLYAASKEIVRRYKPYLDPLDLTYTQYIAMMVLWEKETVSVRELGEGLWLDSGTLTPVLKKLEAKGFITRTRDASDERVVQIRLTKAGKALQDKAAGVPAMIGECVCLTPEDAAQLHRILHTLMLGLKEDANGPQ